MANTANRFCKKNKLLRFVQRNCFFAIDKTVLLLGHDRLRIIPIQFIEYKSFTRFALISTSKGPKAPDQ